VSTASSPGQFPKPFNHQQVLRIRRYFDPESLEEIDKEDVTLVKVVYIDEAGSSDNEAVFTWAAIIIKDRQWLKIERLAKEIIETKVPLNCESTSNFMPTKSLTAATHRRTAEPARAKRCDSIF